MKIKLIFVAKKTLPWLENACQDYIERFQNDWSFESIMVKASDKHTEAKRILSLMPKKNFFLFVLDEKGKTFNSVDFAQYLKKLEENAQQLLFIIGGADGLTQTLKQEADFLLSLSTLTLPHALARLILCEQIYRAYSLSKNLPYHRA